MRARQAAFLGTVMVLLLLSAGWAYLAAPGSAAGDGRLHVVATFYPLYYFATEIGGERARVDALIPFNSEPHTWEPRISDIVNVDQARVFIYNGAGLEPWVGKLLGTLQHRDSLMVVDATSGLPLQQAGPGTTDEKGGPDPHVWLDPLLATEQVELIRKAFCEADPGGSDHYNATAAGLTGRLAALDAAFREGLANRTRNVIVTTHEGFGYLARRYNFTAEAVLGLEPNQQPSAAKLAEIVKQVEDHDLQVVFGEPVYSDRFMQTIAGEVRHQTGRDIQVLVLDGLHGQAGPHAGMDYFQIQQDNLKNLRIGLGVTA